MIDPLALVFTKSFLADTHFGLIANQAIKNSKI